MKKPYKISFCTVSMNRIHHLMKTLPINIADNENYPNLEFILLDYNSTDNIEHFVKNNLSEYLINGKLKYFKTNSPNYFHRSHSRNLLFKLATGDIICNIDADNFTGAGFAAYINEEFSKNENIFLTTLQKSGSKFTRDVLGRICIRKSDFLKISGFDELMANYGFEDYDFTNRLELSGIQRTIFKIPRHLTAIKHQQEERISNEYVSRNLKSIILRQLTPTTTDFYFLFIDGKLKKGVLIDNTFHSYKTLTEPRAIEIAMGQSYSLLENQWVEGSWFENKDSIKINLINNNKRNLKYDPINDCFMSYNKKYHQLKEPIIIMRSIMLFSQLLNRGVLISNLINKRIKVNQNGFGIDTVYQNFNNTNPILIN